MKIGTKSLLFGAHQVLIHPLFVFRAWLRLYGLPWHPALWLCFLVHDWGYFGAEAMDSQGGEEHPELGANIVRFFFGNTWGDFCLFHSRRYAKMKGKAISQLCIADKLATILTPVWLYIPMVKATGEIAEYMKPDTALESEEYLALVKDVTDPHEWFVALKTYMMGVVEKTKDDAVSISQLRWEQTVDHYVAEWGPEHRNEILIALTRYKDQNVLDKDSFVAHSILRGCK